MTMPLEYLERLYHDGDDPWNFRTSHYEQAKFAATRTSLERDHYHSCLEIGCGNGALAEHLAPVCDHYTGLDGVETALVAARRAVPSGVFVQGFFPCALPPGPHDLIVLSEILYFLGPSELSLLSERLGAWRQAEVICVTYLGDTGHPLSGQEAFTLFAAAMGDGRRFETLRTDTHYRIDRHLPIRPGA